MLRVLIHFTHLPEPAVLSHGGFKHLGRAALSDHPPRWISPYRPSRPEAAILVILENTSGTGW
ncbi:hypothetical protein ACFFIQ_21095, partial [Sphingobium indicum]|uniref:hypothetical protein n=1 Tax=Sphingobium indicum TaxID=332055 RepID=UPI0035E91D72